jgi:hypothetical protein
MCEENGRKVEEWICAASSRHSLFLANKKITMCNFWLFPEIKFTMKGNRFDTIPEIKAARKEHLRALTKDNFQSICVPEAYFSVLHMATEEPALHAQ